MKLKTLYLVLSIAGLVLPYWQFVPWMAANGLNFPLFFEQLFVNRISSFFAMDVAISSAVVLVFIAKEGAKLGVRGRLWPVLAVFTVGVSLAFPLFLYLRELRLEGSQAGLKGASA